MKHSLEDWKDKAQIVLARKNVNHLIEYVLRDKTGLLLKQSELHYLWQYHIDFAWKYNFDPAILGLWNHGKTFQVAGRVLDCFGKNKNARVAYICDTDTTAVARSGFIGDLILDNKELRKVYPHIKPHPRKKWSKTKWTLQRDVDVKLIDPSMDATGVFGPRQGQRYDYAIVDDPVNMRNAILQPQDRYRVIDTLDTLLGRLETDGKIIWIGTSFHKHDANERTKQLEGYLVLEHGVNDDITHINTDLYNIPKTLVDEYRKGFEQVILSKDLQRIPVTRTTTKIKLNVQSKEKSFYFRMPIWDQRNAAWLESIRKKRGRVSFQRGFQNKVIDEANFMFPDFKISEVKSNVQWATEDELFSLRYNYILTNFLDHQNQFICGGVDLSGPHRAGKVISVIAVDRNTHHRILLAMECVKGDSIEFARKIKKYHRLYGVEMWYVENNSMQTTFIDMLDLLNTFETEDKSLSMQLPSEPFTTGSNKRDPEIGLPSLNGEFRSNMWTIPIVGYHSDSCSCSYCKFVEEFKTYPEGSTSDTVMALWFAREGARLTLMLPTEEFDTTILGTQGSRNKKHILDMKDDISSLQEGFGSMIKELYSV